MKLFDRIADWLIATAMKTPYSHLRGYMMRYWIIPFKPDTKSVSESGSAAGSETQYPGQFPVLAFLCSLFGIAARVHHILRSDDDRAFHDHPWGFISIILKGGYWEYRPHYDNDDLYCGEVYRWYGPGSVIFRKAKDWHRLVLPEGQTAWTLFITFKWRQRWGFLKNPDGKVYFKDYLEDRQAERIATVFVEHGIEAAGKLMEEMGYNPDQIFYTLKGLQDGGERVTIESPPIVVRGPSPVGKTESVQESDWLKWEDKLS